MRRLGIALTALVLAALDGHAQEGSVPAIVGSATIDPAREITFASGIWPRRVYVGQQVTYQIGIFLSESIRSRLRSNPQFVPPDVRSVMAFDLPVAGRLHRRQVGDRSYDVHVYSRALFPVTAGSIDIAPARLTWQVPLSASIFAREESHSASSSTHRLVVLEPPSSGRPLGYLGAVGQLAVRAAVDAAPKRVGDPFVLTMTVSGVGNVALFPRPAVAFPWGHAVAGPERVRIDSTSAIIRGEKSFEWVVTPREAGAREIPVVRYPYFDPLTERYVVAVSAPVAVTIGGGALVGNVATGAPTDERLPIRRTMRGPVAPPWPSTPWYWLGVLAFPLPALAARWRRRTPRPGRRDAARDALRRWADVPVPDPVEVRRLVRDALRARVPALGEALHRGRGGRDVERVLRRAGVTGDTARDARELLDALDAILYGGSGGAVPDAARRAEALVARVEEEALAAGSARRIRRAGALLAVVCAVTGVAQSGDEVTFGQAVAAWDRGDLVTARAGFARVAERRPRAPDPWMNLGTVGWESGDTAVAVRGWQRALRLEPLATDARTRLAAAPNFRDGPFGDIPPISVNAMALLALAAWGAGWLRVARHARGRGTDLLIGSATLLALCALMVHERQVGGDVVVVLEGAQLREAPAMSGESGARVFVGETARAVVQQGAWSRLRFPDGREGWIDAHRTSSLALPDR